MFRALFDATPHVTWLYGEDLRRVEYVNAAFERVFDRSRAALADAPLSWIDSVHPEDRPRVRAAMEARSGGVEPAPLADFRVVRPSGEIRWLRSSIRRVESRPPDTPAGTFWIETAMDVTAERAATQQIQDEYAFAEKVVGLLGAIVVVSDVGYRVVWWNDRFAALLGGDADRTRGRHLAEIVCRGTGDAARFEAAVAALGPAQHHRCGEARYEASGSAPREIEWTVAALRDADGPVTGYVGVGRDVTAENEARRARRRSEERFVEIVHNLPDRFWLYSIEAGEFVFASGRGPDLWGRELPAGPDALTKIVDFVHPEDRERLARIAARLLRDDDSALSEAEYRVLRPDGEIRWALTRVAPVRDERGKLVELVGLTLDVTVERETARALRERTIELERLLREKVVLLTEIHHRVKNNLQSISGLIHMLAARAHLRPLHETIEALEQRIQTMALVHETLYRSSDLAAVDMQSYLERITRMQIGAPDSTRLKVEIDVRASGVTLDLDSALRCGLIVNELVQNAVKHAFRGRKRGRIEVSMTRTGSRLVARVADDGIGLPAQLDLDSDATLGLRLVRGLAEQLGGTARRAPDAKSAIEIAIDLPG